MDGPHDTDTPGRRSGAVKHSYTISCAKAFRDQVEDLARRRNVNVGDIARSVLLIIPPAGIADFPDPGEPAADDRETVVLKSGPAQGRPWRRKPRLQVRMPPGYDPEIIRRALGLALAMDRGDLALKLEDPNAAPPPPPPPPPPEDKPEPPPEQSHDRNSPAVQEEIERLHAIVSVLAFEPLPGGVSTRAEALHVLGFPPHARPDRRMLRARFRMLATIHHPDSNYGSHDRMSQLNQAMEVLKE